MTLAGVTMASILYFLLWAGLFFVMMRFGCGAHVMGHGHHASNSPSKEPDASSEGAGRWVAPEKDVDPVCHMTVETTKSKTTVYEGHVYHFCSQDCRGKFEGDPKTYLTTTHNSPIAKEHPHAS
jgi:YHS domain-containing protein